MSEMSNEEMARLRRLADEVDRDVRSSKGKTRTLRKAHEHLRRLGAIEFPVDIERRGELVTARIPSLQIEATGRSQLQVQKKVSDAIMKLAKEDPFAILEAIEMRRRETVMVHFEALAT